MTATVLQPSSVTSALTYMSGFGNEFATEAVPGALPVGRNSPQRVRVRPLRRAAVGHRVHRAAQPQPALVAVSGAAGRRAPAVPRDRRWARLRSRFDEVATPPNQLRWDPMPLPTKPTRLRRRADDDGRQRRRCGIHLYAANRSMEDRFFYDADGELLIVPQEGALRVATELGTLDVAPQEIVVMPRGVRFRVELPADGDVARGYVCENYGALLRLPDLGPIGSNGLANPRDFLTPEARYEVVDGSFELVAKFARPAVVGARSITRRSTSSRGTATTRRTSTTCAASTRSARSASTIPTRRSSSCCTSPTDTPGVDTLDFVIFPPRWLAAQDTFRPPWFHRNFASEFMGLIHGAYDAKAEGFVPGGASLHNCMSGHGPDAETFEKAVGVRHVEGRLHPRHDGVHVRDADDPASDAVRARDVAAAVDLLRVLAGTEEQLQGAVAVTGASADDSMSALNETHDPDLTSWVASANAADSDFPIQNLPFAAFRRRRDGEAFRIGVAIGDRVLDLATAARTRGALASAIRDAFDDVDATTLNGFMARGPATWSALRLALSRALRAGADEQGDLTPCLFDQSDVEYAVPARIGDYTDFYASVHHATNIGQPVPSRPSAAAELQVGADRLSRPLVDDRRQRQRLPAAEGPDACRRARASRCSGRRSGSTTSSRSASSSGPATRRQPIPIDRADEHVFGFCLLNDWSARDIQAWEYQPLGPFLAKNFASTISPWIVTTEALAPFRTTWSASPATRSRCRTSTHRRSAAKARSTSCSTRPCRPRSRRRPATRRCRCRARASATRTGPSARWSRITRSTAAA